MVLWGSKLHLEWEGTPCLVLFFATPWTRAHQTPLSMGFPRREYSNELPFPSPRDLPHPKIQPVFLPLAGRFFLFFLSHWAEREVPWRHAQRKKFNLVDSFPCIECFQGQMCVFAGFLRLYESERELIPMACSININMPAVSTMECTHIAVFLWSFRKQSHVKMKTDQTNISCPQTKGRPSLLKFTWKLPARNHVRVVQFLHNVWRH